MLYIEWAGVKADGVVWFVGIGDSGMKCWIGLFEGLNGALFGVHGSM